MKTMVAIVALCAPLLPFAAQAQVYKCVDASGRTVYSQSPCPSGSRSSAIQQRVPSAPPAPAADAKGAKADAPKSAAEMEQDFKKRRQAQQEAEKKAAEERQAAEAKAENCKAARQQLAALDLGGRQSRVNEKGERFFLDEAQIEQEKGRARKAVEANCK